MPLSPSARARRRFDRAFARRLDAFRANLPRAIEGDVDAVHDARVATRRLREALPVLRSAARRAGLKKLTRRVRRVTRALGGVRELDVALQLVEELGTIHSSRQEALSRVHEWLQRERADRRVEMLRALGKMDPDRLRDGVNGFVAEFDRGDATSEWQLVLAARLARRAERLRAAVREAGAVYVAERVHAVRIATKQLRYALELAGELSGLRTGGAVGRLKAMQDLLGRLHDLEVLKERARVTEAEGSVEADRELEALTLVLDEQIRRLHAEYVKQRGRLVTVIDQCRERYCPPLATSPAIAAATLDDGQGAEEHGRGNQPLPGETRHRRGARGGVSRRQPAPADAEGDGAVQGGGEGPDRA